MLFDRTEVNLGDVQAGTTRVVKFKYLGTARITKIIKSCSCTAARLIGNEIHATISYGNKKRDYVKNIRVTVQIEGDDAVYILKVHANVKDSNK